MPGYFRTTWTRIVSYFLAGVFAVLPLVITFAVVAWVAGLLASFLGPGTVLGGLIQRVGGSVSDDSADLKTQLMGWSIVLAGLFALGYFLVELGLRKFAGQLVDMFVARIPLVGQIYGTSKQLVDMLDHGKDDKIQGMVPVICYFGSQRQTAVLALLVSPEHYLLEGRPYQIVIVPTAPVPFGGGLFFMPVDSITPAPMTVDGLMSIYVSMGVTAPNFLQTPAAVDS